MTCFVVLAGVQRGLEKIRESDDAVTVYYYDRADYRRDKFTAHPPD